LGRPWLTTVDAFIGCRSGEMYLPRGNSFKQVSLYPPAKAITKLQDETWFEKEPSDGENSQPIFTIDQIGSPRQPSEENQITNFLWDAEPIYDTSTYLDLKRIFETNIQENSDLYALHSLSFLAYNVVVQPETTLAEISLGKFLHLNLELEKQQTEKLLELLKEQYGATAWDYSDMKGIDPNTCSHHIYTQEGARPVRQHQRRMNPALKAIVKEELQKLLNVNFIYPISDSKWVSPLVVMPKKNEKW
jgi:hypothetical protein